MKKLHPLFIMVLCLLLVLYSCNKPAKTNDELASSDSTTTALKTDSVKTTAVIAIEEDVIKENVLSIESKNLLIADGNWLDRNCFPPRTYSFTADRAFLSSTQTKRIPPAYYLREDTLLIFYKKDSAARYKILSVSNIKMSLQPLQSNGNYIGSCTGNEEILLYRDETVNTIQAKDMVGNWGNGEALLLRKDGTFEYDDPPACTVSGDWTIANGKLELTFTIEDCSDVPIDAVNDIALTNYTLYVKAPSQGEDKYRALYRQDRY